MTLQRKEKNELFYFHLIKLNFRFNVQRKIEQNDQVELLPTPILKKAGNL